MKRLLLLGLLFAQTAFGQLIVPPDATSRCFDIFVNDSSVTTGAGLTGLLYNTASLTGYYHRNTGATATAISLVNQTTLGTWNTGGFKAVDGTNMPGWYSICPPNAAFAAGATSVSIGLKGAANMAPANIRVQIGLDYNVVSPRGTLQAASSTTATIAAAESSADNRWTGSKIAILSGTAAGSYGCVASNVNSTDVLTLDSGGWSGGTPDSTSTYDLVSDAACAGRVNSTGVAAIWANAITEITAVPGVGGITAASLLRYLYQFATYKFDTTNVEQRWYRGDGTTVWTTKDMTDDATTYTRTAHEADD